MGAKGTVIKTQDGGQNWTETTTGGPEHLFSMHVDKKGTARAVGQEGVFVDQLSSEKTSRHLTKIYTWLDSVFFFNDKEGLAVGGRGFVLRTEDGGRSWKRLSGK